MSLGGFAVFLERHHVNRTHGFQFGAHLAIRLIASCEFVAGDEVDCGVGEQSGALESEFVQAGFRHVHGVGLQLGSGGLKLAAPVASLVEKLTGVAQEFIDL